MCAGPGGGVLQHSACARLFRLFLDAGVSCHHLSPSALQVVHLIMTDNVSPRAVCRGVEVDPGD